MGHFSPEKRALFSLVGEWGGGCVHMPPIPPTASGNRAWLGIKGAAIYRHLDFSSTPIFNKEIYF
jgi:hypothetical protein